MTKRFANVPPSLGQSWHAHASHPTLQRLDLDVANSQTAQSPDNIRSVNRQNCTRGPSSCIDRMRVHKDEESDNTDVMQNEEDRITPAADRSGGGEGDEEQERKRRCSLYLLRLREECGQISCPLCGPEISVQKYEENDHSTEPAMKKVDRGPALIREPGHGTGFGGEEEEGRKDTESKKSESIGVGDELRSWEKSREDKDGDEEHEEERAKGEGEE